MKFWTEDAIVTAMQEWAGEHGRQPVVGDWGRAGYGHPSASTVIVRYGSWNAGISAAGFTPRPRGQVGIFAREDEVLARLAVPTSIRSLYEEFELSGDYVRKLVWRLSQRGLVERVDRGVWVAA